MRKAAAFRATEYLRDGYVVGLGTGRTAAYAIERMAAMARDGLKFICIPTSEASASKARSLGLELSTLDEHPEIDVTIDGADEFDAHLNLIKGKGGALVREKIVASATREEIIVVDEEKSVRMLGEKEAVPVELLRFGFRVTLRKLEALGCNPKLRSNDNALYFSDNGNLIADCGFGPLSNPHKLHEELNNIPGVVDNGIFVGLAKRIIVGSRNGVHVIEKLT